MSTQFAISIPESIQDNPRRLKSFNRKKLKQLQIDPYINGHNTIKILRVADKYVKLSEHVFGVYQEHQRYNILNAFTYIQYRIAQIEHRNTDDTMQDIDISKQSLQYRVQYENLTEIFEDMQESIHNILMPLFVNASTPFSDSAPYSIQFNDEDQNILIAFNNGLNVTISKEYAFDCFIVNYNTDLSSIQTSLDFSKFNIINTILQLTHSSSTDAMHFNLMFSRYFMFSENLRKLYSAPVDDTISHIEHELEEFIKKAKLDKVDEYTYTLKPFHQFVRVFTVKKITRVRTLLEVKAINTETGEEFIEYRKTVSKIFHHIQQNAEEISKLIKQHD